MLGKIKNFGKGTLNVGLFAAGLGIVGLVASSFRRDGARRSRAQLRNIEPQDAPVPQMMMPQEMAQPTLMGQPLAPGEHAQRVTMARGGVSNQIGAVNPSMTAVPEGSVQDLGSPANSRV
jgi:hypothetical protein